MRRYFLAGLIMLAGIHVNAQLPPHKYVVKFTDKNNSPYSISNPSLFLSTKAIERRTNQQIPINQTDLPVNQSYVDSIIQTGASLLAKSKWLNCAIIFTTDAQILEKIKSFSFVSTVDSITTTIPVLKTPSPLNRQNNSAVSFANEQSKYLTNNSTENNSIMRNRYNYGLSHNQLSQISLDYLHNMGYNGQGITIAILDAGFNNADILPAFDSLWINNQILGTKDFVNQNSDIFRENSHGMNVLSIIAANLPGKMIGAAPKAQFWLLRSEDANTENIIEEYNWAVAAEFADSVGVDIINSSLGYTTFDAPWMNHSYSDLNGHSTPASIAANIAASKGIIICNSAGNSGDDAWKYIGSPADADNILTVGAVDYKGSYASFSSVGPTADGRIKPTVSAQGKSTVIISTDGTPRVSNGTSFSSPIICGATACLLQAYPNNTNLEIINAIIESSSQFANPDNILGYGIPNFAACYMMLSNKKIAHFDQDNQIDIFPNPFTDILNILFCSTDTDYISVDVYDLTGKKVFADSQIQRNTGYTFFSLNQLSFLRKGVYSIQISSDKNIFTRKLIKL